MSPFGAMHFNDGYTEEWNGIQYRRLLVADRSRIADLILQKKTDTAERLLFQPPYVFSDRVLADEEMQYLFTELMENPCCGEDQQNLILSTQLLAQNPKLAIRSCETCRKWWFNEETGTVVKVGGKYLERKPQAKTACDTARGCPKGHYSAPIEPSPRNRQAINHYLEWEAVGCPHPECPIMRRNWKWIKRVFGIYGHPALHAGVHRQTDERVAV